MRFCRASFFCLSPSKNPATAPDLKAHTFDISSANATPSLSVFTIANWLCFSYTGTPNQLIDPSAKNANPPAPIPAVRFASKVEEFDPEAGRSRIEPTKGATFPTSQLPGVTPEQIKALSQSLADTNLQEQRMKSFSYQAFSLPPSRVCQLTPFRPSVSRFSRVALDVSSMLVLKYCHLYCTALLANPIFCLICILIRLSGSVTRELRPCYPSTKSYSYGAALTENECCF